MKFIAKEFLKYHIVLAWTLCHELNKEEFDVLAYATIEHHCVLIILFRTFYLHIDSIFVGLGLVPSSAALLKALICQFNQILDYFAWEDRLHGHIKELLLCAISK